MSGPDLIISVLGLVPPVLQAAIAAKDRLAKPTAARMHARDIAELNNDAGQEFLAAIYSNLQVYREVVEPNVEERDRVFASNIHKAIYKVIKQSQETAQELDHASKDKQVKPADLRALEDKLRECAQWLNGFQLSLMNRLLLRQFPRLGRDGDIAFVQPPTEQTEISEITLRSDIEPIRIPYDSDLELDWPVSNGDTKLLEELFESRGETPACRERRPEVVITCLDYSADPTVVGEDGLGTIHNAIGTADVEHDSPEALEILTLLIDHGVEASAPDSTEQRFRPLHRAAMTKNVSATRFLLDKDPEMVNLVDAEGKTALYQACATPNQKMALVKELMEKGADFADKPRPLMPDYHGQSIGRYLDAKGLN
ncbi:MAG: hypothetical protein Q9191_003201 [Dirinaria sp. TL-2023a]